MAGLRAARIEDLVVAISALSAGLGRPGARLRVWCGSAATLAEVDRLSPVEDPLAGREWPPPRRGPTLGLWLANQLCDLVQLRSSSEGATVRLHVNR
jgi:hypothetical protein